MTRRQDRSERYASILRDFAQIATDAADADWLLGQATRQLARAVGVKHAKVMRYRPEHGDLLVVAGVGWKEGVVGHATLGADMASPPGRALQTRQCVLSEDIRGRGDLRQSDFLRDHGVVAVVNAPVMVDGIAWGVLEADSTEPGAFDGKDAQFVETFAFVLGMALRHQQAERLLVAKAEEAARAAALAQTSMREMRHRVKNNFQVILSMMALKAQRVPSGPARHAFQDIMDRVTAIALAHDQLAMREDHGTVSSAEYLGALCSNLGRSTEGLRLETELDEAELRIDRVVALGLILNELVTNSIKYALKERPDGVLQVRFSANPVQGQATLTVADQGPGMGEPREGGSGLRIVEALASQLGGHIDLDTSERGTTVEVRFPLIE